MPHASETIEIADLLTDSALGAVLLSLLGRGRARTAGFQALQQHMPAIFGIGLAENRIWAGLCPFLDTKEIKSLDSLYEILTQDEREGFQLVITGVPLPSEMTGSKDQSVKIPMGEMTEKDNRVLLLKKIAKLIDEFTPTEARKILIRQRIIPDESMLQKMRHWLKENLRGWIRKNLCMLFGVKEISDIDEKLLSDMLNKLGVKINKLVDSRVKLKDEESFSWNPWVNAGWELISSYPHIGYVAFVAICAIATFISYQL